MKKHVVLALICFTTACLSTVGNAEVELGPEHRPKLPEGHPDLTQGEGPDAETTSGYWFLHCGRTKGWAYTTQSKDASPARQILLTEVPGTSPVRHELKVGDVILGVDGKYFTKNAVKQFRETSVPATRADGEFDIIVWRKGWDKERNVRVSLKYLPLDFTKGDTPGDETDWNLGPTGARGYMQGLNYKSWVTRQILVTKVHPGSPADGVLSVGDVILGVEGEAFSYDARWAFVAAVNRAETEEGEGKLSVRRWRNGKTEDVIIPIKVMGNYSDTTPWNCAKSEKILSEALDYLVKNDEINAYSLIDGRTAVTALAFLATGEEKYVEIAREKLYELAEMLDDSGEYPPKWGYSTWGWSYANIALAEYYCMTKDEKVLPAIRKLTMNLVDGQSGVGSWGHNSAATGNRFVHGYGALNQCGNIAFIALAMGRECGIEDPALDAAIKRGQAFLDGFVDSRTVPYGEGLRLDAVRHDDNGKNSAAAVGYAILGEPRGTEYYGRMTVASSEDREFGHTGVWWSYLWGPLAAARVGQPATTAFLNEMGWLHDLERRWDGGFVYQGKINIGYGLDENGKQRGGREHTTPGWDTTACRVLMYCLPRQKLYITGKGGVTVEVPQEEVPSIIELGRPTDPAAPNATTPISERTDDALLTLLTDWSPKVRTMAAATLAERESAAEHVPTLLEMLDSDNRYAVYGACQALRAMNAGSDTVIDALMPLLENEDRVIQRQAAAALGASGSMRAAERLLRVAMTDYRDDINDVLHRTVADALFGKGGVLSESIDGVDRDLLLAATQRLLATKGGDARLYVTQGVLEKLPFAELATIWPSVTHTMIDYPLTAVGPGAKARISVAQLIRRHNIDQGPELYLEYLKNLRWHDAGARVEQLTELMSGYGTSAQSALPALRAQLKFIKEAPEWSDTRRPPDPHYSPRQIEVLEQMIEAIEAATESPEVIPVSADE